MIPPKNRPSSNDADHTPWMLTLADLLSLLLTFFVLLFSMRQIPSERWQAVVETLSREFSPSKPLIDIKDKPEAERAEILKIRGLNLGYIENVITAQFEGLPELKDIQVQRQRDRLILSLPANLFFMDKETRLSAEAEKYSANLAQALLVVGNKIIIAAHSNLLPLADKSLSPWAFSLMRAQVFADLMTQKGYHLPIWTVAYGVSRLHDLDPDLTLAERYALADRIDIIILDQKRIGDPYKVF